MSPNVALAVKDLRTHNEVTSVRSFLATATRQCGFPLGFGPLLHGNLLKQPQAEHSKLMNAETYASRMADSVGKRSLSVHHLSDSSVHKNLG